MIEPVEKAGVSEVLQDLQALGFSEYEAKAYMALLSIQPATGYEVSKLAGLPKANSYAVLESLSKKEAVLPVSENPVRYTAVAPENLFDRIAKSTGRRCARLIEQMPKMRHLNDQEYVWTLTGAEAISAKIEEMIEAAADHLWVKASETILDTHRPALQRAAERGVAILIILFGSRLDDFRFPGKSRTFLHEGNGIPVGIAPFLITLTRDFEEAMVAELRAPAHGSYTRNKPLVTMADTLIRHEIYFAEIFERFGNEIQAAFGPALIDLRRNYLPQPQVEALEMRLQTRTPTPKLVHPADPSPKEEQ